MCSWCNQREEAWKITRFPCVGRWRFLHVPDPQDPTYQQLLFRLTIPKSTDAVLDLGCFLGQALRQFRADGVPGSRLFGIDLQSQFFSIGYELFRDADRLGATFLAADILDLDDRKFRKLKRQVTIIHATSFFHLFSWTQQVYIGKRMVSFLRPGTKNALVYGRQAGTIQPGKSTNDRAGAYLHDQISFQRLWDEIGSLTNTRWKVEMEREADEAADLVVYAKDVYPVSFKVYQIS